MFPVSQFGFYRGVSAAALWEGAPPAERERLRSIVDDCLARVRALSSTCAANFAYQSHLLQAAVHRMDGDLWAAGDCYERAIGAAAGNDYARAVSFEVAGEFWLAAEREEFGRLYLDRAVAAYSRWGALSKVDQLRRRLADSFPAVEPARTARDAPGATAPLGNASSGSGDHLFDLRSIRRATEAVTGETQLGESIRIDHRIVRPDGTTRWMSESGGARSA